MDYNEYYTVNAPQIIAFIFINGVLTIRRVNTKQRLAKCIYFYQFVFIPTIKIFLVPILFASN